MVLVRDREREDMGGIYSPEGLAGQVEEREVMVE